MAAKILVADDDKSMLGLYDRIFSVTDYSVCKAESFAEASRLIREGGFDLLITDFKFYDGLGTDLARLFCELGGGKCLLVTGSSPSTASISLADVHRLIEKPFKVEDFMKSVSEALA